MSNYTKTTNFAAKDSLPSGNAAKIVKGTEIDTEFNNIATASATKANSNNAALTGTTVFETLSDGTLSITGWVDEDNMSSDSASLVPTQQSVKAYVDSQVTAQDLDVTDGSTSIDIDLDSESLGILGGTGIDSTASGTGVTLAIDATVATLAGTQTLSNKTLSTPVVSGNLTTDGLIDGRDVATDGAKLDGIESGATADQTAAEIKTAYESNADTNAFTDADESKLDGIEASADVTDTANVTAAGALMDSELTSEASVKALNQGVATTDSPTFAGVTAPITGNVTGNLTGNVTGNVTGNLTGDVTGDVTGNVTGNLTGSVLTAAQTNITSVGNLTSLQVIDGDFNVLASEGGGAAESLLIADVSTKRVGVNKAAPSVSLDIGSNTDAVHVPTGTTAQRPTGAAGYFRYNSTLEQFEGYTDAWGAIGGGGGSNLVSDTMTGDGSDTTLTLSNDPLNENNTQVYIDGVYQNKDTYSVSGTTLTFSTAPPNGSAVEAMTIQPTAVNVPADASVTSAKLSGDLVTPGALDVTGTVTADGLTVDGNASTTGVLTLGNAGVANAFINSADSLYINIDSNSDQAGGNDFQIGRNSTAVASEKIFLAGENGDISFYEDTGTTPKFFWDSSAESLGIGTTSPATNLHIQSASEPAITLFHTGVMASQIGLDSTGSLTFGIDGSTGATERMRITSAGNVGINQSSPAFALCISDGSNPNRNGMEIAIGTSDTSGNTIQNYNRATSAYTPLNIAGSILTFGAGTSAAEAMRIDAGGNLLVGTTSNSDTSGEGFKFKPDGEGTDKPRLSISTAGFQTETCLSIYSTAVSALRFAVNAAGTISATNTTITSLSDQRVKENVRDLDDGLTKVLQLQPRKFDWKEGQGRDISNDRGFIAQEFEQVFPDMIEEWKDKAPEGGEPYKAINANLIPTLVKAIQEQQETITALTARIETLENN